MELAGSLEGVNGRTSFDAAAQGDPAAGKVIDQYVDYLGCGVASLVNIFQPEVILIGGGPSAQGETLMAPVRYILNREDYARQPPPHPAGTGGPGQRRGPHWRGAAAAVPVELQG